MPFTVAHAAAAWPAHRAFPRLPLAALIIGTLSPDFEYWLRLAPAGRLAHSPSGILVFCIPASFIVWTVFRRLVRPALIPFIPVPLPAPRTSRLGGLVAAALGACTHVAWDGFTHGNDCGVMMLPVLRGEVAPGLVPGLRWYKLLQHASTILGLAALVLWIARWVRLQPETARRLTAMQRQAMLRGIGILAAAGAVGALLNGIRGLSRGLSYALGLSAVGGMVGVSLGLLAIGIQSRRRLRSTAPMP